MEQQDKCRSFLKKNAKGKWFESRRFKNESGNGYLHHIASNMVLLRVEFENNNRMFYWIYDINDAIAFNTYVANVIHAEAHELIIGNQCRLFYDIDLKLDEMQQCELAEYYDFDMNDVNKQYVMNSIANILACIYKDATIMSLSEHGNDMIDTLKEFDWMFCMRNRPYDDDYKISIHIITNIFVPLNVCSAIAKDVKTHILINFYEQLEITEQIAEYLSDAIDDMQYRTKGSLGLPLGCKNTSHGIYQNIIIKNYDIPMQYYFITQHDQFSLKNIIVDDYDITTPKVSFKKADSAFVKNALKHISNIKDYNPKVWDLRTSTLKNSTMYVRRYAPSHCSICDRYHDNDNTMFLMFDSDNRIASWKCTHAIDTKGIVFYQEEVVEELEDNEDDLSAFASRYANVKTQKNISSNIQSTTRNTQSDNSDRDTSRSSEDTVQSFKAAGIPTTIKNKRTPEYYNSTHRLKVEFSFKNNRINPNDKQECKSAVISADDESEELYQTNSRQLTNSEKNISRDVDISEVPTCETHVMHDDVKDEEEFDIDYTKLPIKEDKEDLRSSNDSTSSLASMISSISELAMDDTTDGSDDELPLDYSS